MSRDLNLENKERSGESFRCSSDLYKKNNDTVVSIEDVGKVFTTESGEIEALRGINLDIKKSEFVAVIGPSGCGKSTLLRLITGLDNPTSGSVSVKSQSSIGIAFQEHRLLPWLNIEENICLPSLMVEKLSKESLEKSKELCELVGLSGFEKKMPAELSGGMRQRASFARALYSNPKLMLLDEPFGALDALTREKIIKDAEEIWINKGFSAFLITHSISEAVSLADRVIVMSARPGVIAHEVKIELPRPRAEHLDTVEFSNYCTKLREFLEI